MRGTVVCDPIVCGLVVGGPTMRVPATWDRVVWNLSCGILPCGIVSCEPLWDRIPLGEDRGYLCGGALSRRGQFITARSQTLSARVF
eukprot:5748642-Pyramimonas_sp.AAC.1